MSAVSSPIREPGSNAAITAALAGLVLLGAAMGFSLVFGEVQALWVALSVIGCIGVLYDFRLGALLLIVMLPLAPTTSFPHALFGITGMNPLNLMIAATVGSFILGGRKAKAGPVITRPLVLLYVLPLAAAGALGARHAGEIAPILYELMAINFLDAGGYLRDMLFKPLLTVAAGVIVGWAVARSQKPERFLVPIGVSIFAICLMSIYYLRMSGATIEELSSTGGREFFSGLGYHANSLGRLLAVAFAMLLFAWAESKDPKFKFCCVGLMGMVVVALVATFSRGAFLGFMIVAALFFLWRFNAKTAAIVLLVGVVGALLLPGQVYERVMMGFATGDWNEISAGRIDGIWLPILPELWKSPLWGQGLGSVMWSDAMRHGLMLEVTHPHNAYLEALLDLGVLGTGLLVAYFVHVWRNLRKLGSNAFLSPEMRGFFQGTAAGLLSFLVTGFAGSSLAPLPEHAFLWIAIGMMYGQLARRPAG